MFKLNLQRFASGANTVVNTTVGYTNAQSGVNSPYDEGGGLSQEMKQYYSDYLIDMAEPKLVHDQFGQKRPIPKNNGKVIEFRKYDPLPKMTTPLAEGVTPRGQKLNMGTVSAEVKQYGGYIELSDVLLLAAIDNNLVQATKVLGGQAGRTLDTITREVLSGGTNVQYAEGQVDDRCELVGGAASGNHYLTVDAVRRAVRYLKTQNAEPINGSFVGIIHPDAAYDLMSDPKWVNVKTYSDPEGIYQGEIGKIENVRFVETSEAKIFNPTLKFTVSSYSAASGTTPDVGVTSGYKLTVKEPLSKADIQAAISGELDIILCDKDGGTGLYVTVVGGLSTSGILLLEAAPSFTPAAGDVICTDDGGFMGRAVYSTLILGDNAYGTTELSGGGLEHITKQLGSAGTGDPLNQRATAGWKATKAAVRLVEPYMVRIETASTFDSDDN